MGILGITCQRLRVAVIIARMIRSHIPLLLAGLAMISVNGIAPAAHAGDVPGRAEALSKSCATPGAWINAASGETLTREALFADLAQKPVVLLGEHHDQAEHHRWQLQTIAALNGRGVKLVLGFEMLPRRVQPALDRWVKGELTKKAFLAETDWWQVWGYAPELYMPLFDFARMNGVPMVALNVQRSLVSRVSAKGWANVPADEREGISDPASPADDYKRSLAEVWAMKQAMKAAKAPPPTGATPASAYAMPERPKLDDAKLAEILGSPDFQHFVEAQLVWDRAMAQGIFDARRAHPEAVVVGIMGSGHLEGGFGVPHQLRALGSGEAAILLPVEAGEACTKADANSAYALFTLKTPAVGADARPRLGVMIATKDNAAVINGVMPDSVGAAAGLRKGDTILRAAGVDIHGVGDLNEVVSRQAWGTWLPLNIKRDGKDMRVVAKFGAQPEGKP